MFPGINPKQMQAVMKQMGMSQTEIPSSKVIIEKEDGNKIVINNPSVTKIKMQGQETFQVTGDISEDGNLQRVLHNSSNPTEVEGDFSDEDIKVIMEKTNCSEEEARNTLEETGDLAEAILKLSE